MKYEDVKKLPHYAYITEDQVSNGTFLDDGDIISAPDAEQEALYKMIYAPDPETGVPRSDLAIVYSKDADPQLARFIQDTLQRSHPQEGVSFDNPDDAIELMKNRSESFEKYSARLREIANESMKSNASTNESMKSNERTE